MEGDNVDISRANGTPVSSRWNPTKEQISMLESLYRQGIRTPSADQIQQITGRLKAFGHIEGKNVFYWFQNHKARQRQKQKQESMAYLNRFLHKPTPPLFPPPPPPCANVVCGPYYLPQMDVGYYPQYPKVLLPGGGMRRRLSRTSERVEKSDGGYNLKMHLSENINDQETLPLFPLHPTGILEGNSSSHHDHALDTAENYSTSAPEITGVEECSNIGQPFFDFFSGHRSCESD